MWARTTTVNLAARRSLEPQARTAILDQNARRNQQLMWARGRTCSDRPPRQSHPTRPILPSQLGGGMRFTRQTPGVRPMPFRSRAQVFTANPDGQVHRAFPDCESTSRALLQDLNMTPA
jgi:hypothetical protein